MQNSTIIGNKKPLIDLNQCENSVDVFNTTMKALNERLGKIDTEKILISAGSQLIDSFKVSGIDLEGNFSYSCKKCDAELIPKLNSFLGALSHQIHHVHDKFFKNMDQEFTTLNRNAKLSVEQVLDQCSESPF